MPQAMDLILTENLLETGVELSLLSIHINTSIVRISHKTPIGLNHQTLGTEAPGGDREGCGSPRVGQRWCGSPI